MAYTTIDKPTDYFNTLLYTGDGSSSRSITGVGFATDWIWVKERSSTSQHQLVDKVRGFDKRLQSDSSDPEDDDSSPFLDFKSLDSDGWTMGNGGAINESGQTYVAWNWLAGGSASSNSDGSITSSVSANTTSGFSIVSYTGTGSNATVGHGLGSVPSVIIVKDRSTSGRDWMVYNKNIGNTKYQKLNTTDAETTSSTVWNNTTPTSSVFSIGTNSYVNGSTKNFIAYCFAEKKGFSKFGSYTGNGSSDGSYIHLGFKPAFIMVKDYTGAGNNWFIWDNKRDGYNVVNRYVRPNLSDAEGYYEAIDILSNGFKNRNTSGSANGSGTGYIYMAFAESPFVTSTGIPTTAR